VCTDEGSLPLRPHLIELIDGDAQVVFVRAPQGFGKTTLIRQWAASAPPLWEVAWCHNQGVNASATFWRSLCRALVSEAIDVPALDEDSAHAQVEAALAARPHPVTVVLDNFHSIRDQLTISRLMTLLQDHEHLRLIVVTRSRHALEAHASNVCTLQVIDADLLGLQSSDVVSLAGRYAANIGITDAELIVDAMGAWPAMIDKVVRHLAKRPITPDRVASALQLTDDTLTSWLLDEIVSPEHIDLMVQLALAEHLTLGAAQFLTQDESVGDSLNDLVAQGLLTRSIDLETNETLYEFPTVIRRLALAGMGRVPSADGDAQSSALARWFKDQGRPDVALRQALAGRDWPFIGELFESSWAQLVNLSEDVLVTALRQIPADVTRAYPKTHAVRHLVLGAVMSPEDLPAPAASSFLEVVALARKVGAVAAVEMAVADHIVLRRSGRYEDAVRAARIAHYLSIIIGSKVPEYIRPFVPMARLQTALTFELAGRGKEAAEQLAHALAALERAPEVNGYELNQITGVLAVKSAIEGDRHATSAWLDRQVEIQGSVPRVWLMPYVPTGAQIARAIDAVDQLDRPRAEDELVALRLLETRDELWSMASWAQARYDLVWSDHAGAFRNLDLARLRYQEWHNPESAAESSLLAAEVDLLLASGQGNRASALLLRTTSTHPLVLLARARLAHLTGDNAGALAGTRDVLRAKGATDRVRLNALLLRAAVAAQNEGTRASLALWEESCKMAQRLGDPLLPFAVIGARHLHWAAKHIPAIADIIERCHDRGVTDDVFPEHVSVINLTEREHAILEKLADDISVASIARAHFVSEATIKTQMRSLYAKLDAHSRDEAVAAAQTAGIIE